MFYKCNVPGHAHSHAHGNHAPATDHGHQVTHGSKTQVVDIHCHRQSMPATERMKAEAERVGREALAFGSEMTKKVNKQQLEDLHPKMTSVEERLADMDKMGVDVQAISIPPYQYYYWAEDEVGREISQQMNDELAGVVAGNPDRFVALGTVPLQNTEMAIAELDRCVNELGMRGVELSTNVNGEELSNPRLEKFWARVVELDVVVFLHPAQFTSPERMDKHYFVNLFGHPTDTSLAIGYLIFDGVLKRHPGLKICIAHGGGWLPSYAARMDHAYHARPDCREVIDQPPSTYLKKLYFDTMVFDADQLEFLIRKYGADHICLGTDYPYDMGDYDPLGLIGKVDGLTEADVAAISGMNAAKLLKL